MKIKLLKSVSLTDNIKSHYERKLIVEVDGVEQEVVQLVIPNAILSTTTQDVQGDILSESFLSKAFNKVKKILVNEEHKENSDVGHVENLKIEKNKVIGDIVVQSQEAIDKVKAGIYKALSIEGFATAVKKYLNARIVEDGQVNAVALTSNPANKDAFFAKSDDESIPVADVVEINEDYKLAKSDTTTADDASSEPAQAQTDTQTADDVVDDVKPADEQAQDVSDVNTEALQIEIIKNLEQELANAKAEIERVKEELTRTALEEKEQLAKSADSAKKKADNENYILKLSVANAKKAEEAHLKEIAELKKSLDEANKAIEEYKKAPLLKKGVHNIDNDEIDEEFAEEYLIFDDLGNIDKKKTLAKALFMSTKKLNITD